MDKKKEFADTFRSGELHTFNVETWSDALKPEFKDNERNGHIGNRLVLENDRIRGWHITFEPGETLPVHRLMLDYFWTAITPGRFLQRTYDGTTCESDYPDGMTHYNSVTPGEFALHKLENVGNATVIFCAVESRNGGNDALPIGMVAHTNRVSVF